MTKALTWIKVNDHNAKSYGSLFVHLKLIFVMRYLFVTMLAITFVSCSQKKISGIDHKKLELYRELAFCKCMEQSVRQFNVLDTSENYAGPAYTEIDAADVIDQKLYKKVDSLISTAVIKDQIAHKIDTATKYVSEGAKNKTSYTYSCLQLYNSEKLKSILMPFVKK